MTSEHVISLPINVFPDKLPTLKQGKSVNMWTDFHSI